MLFRSYTVNTAGFQVHSVPTIHYSGTFDDQAVILGAWDGVNLSSIWVDGILLGGTKGDVGASGVTGNNGPDGSVGLDGATGILGASGFGLHIGSTGLTGATEQTIEQFAANEIGTAKYLIQGVDSFGNVQVTQVILTQNASGVYITEYATLELSAPTDSGDLMLLFGTQDLTLESGTVDLN